MNIQKLNQILEQKNLTSGIKEMFIGCDDDYFKQCVIIITKLPVETREDIVDDLDDYFSTQGYKTGDFVRAVYNYETELNELIKKVLG